MKIFILFLIIQLLNQNIKHKIIIKDTYFRRTYNVYDKENKILFKKIYLTEDDHKRNLEHTFIMYISNDDKNFMEIALHNAIDDLGKGYKIAKANKFRPIKKWKDTGVERYYKLKIFLNEKKYEFDIFGDYTYFYLYDEDAIKKQNNNAINYLLSKDYRIKEFLELMANDMKGNFSIFNPFKYVLSDKDIIKDLNLNIKKYKLKNEYLECTEIERILDHNCYKFVTFPKK